jgi:peptidoglycan/LPS O-acetylase OafA/YrhL
VDFFFLLSGFVIAYAYDDRWAGMGQWEFYGAGWSGCSR